MQNNIDLEKLEAVFERLDTNSSSTEESSEEFDGEAIECVADFKIAIAIIESVEATHASKSIIEFFKTLRDIKEGEQMPSPLEAINIVAVGSLRVAEGDTMTEAEKLLFDTTKYCLDEYYFQEDPGSSSEEDDEKEELPADAQKFLESLNQE
jgi:hypothetical protein